MVMTLHWLFRVLVHQADGWKSNFACRPSPASSR